MADTAVAPAPKLDEKKAKKLLTEATAAHGRVKKSLFGTLKDIFQAGEALAELKEMNKEIDYPWRSYCKQYLPFSYNTASYYIKCYENQEKISEFYQDHDDQIRVSVSGALKAIRLQEQGEPKTPAEKLDEVPQTVRGLGWYLKRTAVHYKINAHPEALDLLFRNLGIDPTKIDFPKLLSESIPEKWRIRKSMV